MYYLPRYLGNFFTSASTVRATCSAMTSLAISQTRGCSPTKGRAGTVNVRRIRLAKAMRRAVPKYMLPNVYHRLERLPYNANGKVDRVRLKETYLDGAN